MTIANDLVHPDPSKVRFNRTLVRSAYTAKPDDLVACQSSVAPITVTLPATVSAGACIAVGDDDDNAEANEITIGSSATIDGVASITIAQSGGLEIFIFTGSMWIRIGASRLVSAASRDIPVLSIDWIKKALATAAAWSYGLIWSPVDAALYTAPTSYGLNETYGYYFRADVAMRLLGVRISSGPTGSGRTFDVGAWSTVDTVTPIATASETAVSNDQDMQILFDDPISLAPIGNGNRYVVAFKCNGAAYVPAAGVTVSNGSLNVGASPNPATWPIYVAPKVMFHTFAWTGGGSLAFPPTAIGSIVPALEPILEYV
jgi:hypothetical protein